MIKTIRRWLAPNTENRAGYTDLLTNAILSQATGADSIYAGALEIAAGTFSRAFASAEPSGVDARYFPATVLAEIGRDLIECGESVWDIMPERLRHVPSLDTETNRRQAHFRWSTDVHSGRGIGPLARASALSRLSNSLENGLSKEAGATIGYVLPVPSDGQDQSVTKLREDLRTLDGKIALVETAAGGWDAGRVAAPRRDYEPRRLGPDMPQSNIQMYKEANRIVLAACGIPTEIVDEGTDGTSSREAWRRFLHSTLQPIGKLISAQALESNLQVTLSFESLFASDVTGRARAFNSLVQGGMDIEQAAAVTGLLAEDV